MGLFNKDKIYFYIVTPANNYTKYLTIVTKKEDALSYVETLIRLERNSHFTLWRELRKLEDTEEVWKQYFNTCVDNETRCKYVVTKICYKRKDVAAIIRMFCGCIPLGLSFDLEHEYLYLQEKLKNIDKQLASELEEELNDDENSDIKTLVN